MPAAPEPLLDVADMQGNILAGFNKDHQLLVALNIAEVAGTRRWLARVWPQISTLTQVLQFNSLFRSMRAQTGSEPVGLVASWFNIAFSHDAIVKLTSTNEADALPGRAFRAGLSAQRARGLADPVPEGERDPTAKWVVGSAGSAPDIFVIIASDRPTELEALALRVLPNPSQDGVDAPRMVWKELGETLPNLPGHEHFGWKDGVSQPGVRGLVSQNPEVLLTPRILQSAPDGEVEFAHPGQPLVWPGNFVLGYPHTDRNDGKPLGPAPLAFDWFRNGSFLVFRRLNQNVAGFAQFLEQQAASLAKTPGFAGLTPMQLGSLLVGRWPSGAPLSRMPLADDPVLAADRDANNDFLFASDSPLPNFLPGHSVASFPLAFEATKGPLCPHAAHIFKVNPRDHTTDVGPDFDTLTRRILRRGSPFGPPLISPLGGDDGVERGLHFLCYQASIEDQFEFLQKRWANTELGPTPGGHDIIIGQTKSMERTMEVPAIVRGQQPEVVTTPTQWVTPTGGGYFFAPSVSAIRDRFASGLPNEHGG